MDGSYDPETGRARFVIPPGGSKTVALWVEAGSAGEFSVASRAEYGPESGGQPRGTIELSHTFTVTEPPQAAEAPELLQATEPPEQLQATEASAGVPAAEPRQEPSGGGGCASGTRTPRTRAR